ncbi:tyrosine-type recombinase/integrase [Bacillus sp. ISL-18]|uniref:tyrosine-type recombinase/integrase n=1 Tax=Bacillus sp. ISL-18 TaxID=2819118 RepID=UPI0035A93EF3
MARNYRKVVENSGLPSIRFHDLRHTHATLMLQQGVHPKVVSERLVHSTIMITMDTTLMCYQICKKKLPINLSSSSNNLCKFLKISMLPKCDHR